MAPHAACGTASPCRDPKSRPLYYGRAGHLYQNIACGARWRPPALPGGCKTRQEEQAQLAVDHGVALVWPTSVNVIALMHASRKSKVNACGEAHLPELYVRPEMMVLVVKNSGPHMQ